MHNTRRTAVSLAVFFATAAPALAQLRICTWNVTNYTVSGSPLANARDDDFKTAIYGVIPNGLALAGKSMSPDVFIGQEFGNGSQGGSAITVGQNAVDTFRNLLNSAPGSPGDWAAAPFLDGADTESAFFYRTSKVQYLGTTTIAIGSSSTANQPRDTRRYDFRPIGYSAPQSSVAVYSVHLKAQGGTNSTGRRLIECQRIRDNAEGTDTNGAGTALPAGYNFILAGDTNVQNSGDTEYQALVASQTNNSGQFFDPIKSPGNWNNNSAYRFIHTQDQAGQMDDRHDQILISASLKDGAGLDYIGNTNLTYSTFTWNDSNHSYRSWGNDGTSYDLPLRTSGNTMVGDTIATALVSSAASGGHLPVIADFRVPAKFSASSSSIAFGTVGVNAAASTGLTVTNSGDTAKWTVNGIAALRYTMTVSGPFTVAGAGVQQTDSAGGVGNTHTVTMNTSSTGPKSGSITFVTDAPETASFTVTLSGNVALPPCPADLGRQGGLTGSDGLLDNNDFIVFIDYFFVQNPLADLGSQGGISGSDGQFDNNDFIAFIDAFFAGCPG
ncbi:MAG: GC-type dockerin domain-anchored protein [Phycisphaerales bacterium]|nr:GC-type dockerin domain-anchored protein [Phycisphaerales bacterium]